MIRLSIGGVRVYLTKGQHSLLYDACYRFTGGELFELDEGANDDDQVVDFDELNTPISSDEELTTCYLGVLGAFKHGDADAFTFKSFGVWFKVIAFLDSADTYFLSTSEED